MKSAVPVKSRGHVRRFRSGMSSLEVVMTTAIMLPAFAYLAYSAIRVFRVIFTVVGSMVGSPLL